MSILDGTVIEIRSTLAPPLVLDLTPSAGPPGPLLRVARPRITVTRNGTKIVDLAPQGAPEAAPPYWVLGVGALVLLLGFYIVFR